MELRQLQTFCCVAETKNFTKAARELHYSQSNVSMQIQALEEELGVCLFERLGKRVILTKAGECLHSYASALLRLADEASRTVKEFERVRGALTIATSESIGTYRLPSILHQFRKHYPQVQIVVRPTINIDNLEMCRQLSENEVDIALILQHSPLQFEQLIVKSLTKESLLLVTHPFHRLVSKRAIDAQDLARETILLPGIGCTYRGIVERVLTDGVGTPASVIEVNSIEAIKQCVKSAMGIAILPHMAVQAELAQEDLVALAWERPELSAVIQLIWHKDKRLTPVLFAFIDFVQEHLHEQPLEHNTPPASLSPLS
jgi:DNA-binding transcriptional LysR family regulator